MNCFAELAVDAAACNAVFTLETNRPPASDLDDDDDAVALGRYVTSGIEIASLRSICIV